MAQRVEAITVGVDVAKDHLDIALLGQSSTQRVANTPSAIGKWLRSLCGPVYLAIEATNTFHLELVDQAVAKGCTVYLINGFRLNRYRDSIGGRAKTDSSDAQLLARYLDREREDLRPFEPLCPAQRRVWMLLRRRAKVVNATTQLRQTFAQIKEVRSSAQATLRQLERLANVLEARLVKACTELDWTQAIARLESIYGVGRLTASAMVATYHRGRFTSADALVGYLGLDVRVRDSGRCTGKRKLTKQGDGECRRLLFNAARTAARGPYLKAYYQGLIARGLSTTAATVAVSRKLVRICFALLRDGTSYAPKQATPA